MEQWQYITCQVSAIQEALEEEAGEVDEVLSKGVLPEASVDGAINEAIEVLDRLGGVRWSI